jgi:hypothetical protein
MKTVLKKCFQRAPGLPAGSVGDIAILQQPTVWDSANPITFIGLPFASYLRSYF